MNRHIREGETEMYRDSEGERGGREGGREGEKARGSEMHCPSDGWLLVYM